MRESPALDILELLQRRGGIMSYTDPYVPVLRHGTLEVESIPEERVADVDCAVVCTNNAAFDYPTMPKRFPVVVDTRNALKGVTATNLFRL
jgi:UDP-N-acetyl-D-glucosamine dehydrogenase